MAAFTDLLTTASRPVLWLDASAYAGRLLAGGSVPWLNAAELIGWQRKAQGLLKSDVVAVQLAAVCDAWLSAHAALKSSMAEKRRAVYPLKVLLADEALRAHVLEVVNSYRAVFTSMPLALVAPSPRAWAAGAYVQAHGADAEVEIGDDEADSAAMYMADFLRSFADSGVDILLLDEQDLAQALSASMLACYQTVSNVAEHYRWDMGLRLSSAGAESVEGAGLAFVVSEKAQAGVSVGLEVPAEFWDGADAAAVPAGGFRYVHIPEQAQPEGVLDRLGVLR
jgi:hypothetical protein